MFSSKTGFQLFLFLQAAPLIKKPLFLQDELCVGHQTIYKFYCSTYQSDFPEPIFIEAIVKRYWVKIIEI